jgi:hypothetical protein
MSTSTFLLSDEETRRLGSYVRTCRGTPGPAQNAHFSGVVDVLSRTTTLLPLGVVCNMLTMLGYDLAHVGRTTSIRVLTNRPHFKGYARHDRLARVLSEAPMPALFFDQLGLGEYCRIRGPGHGCDVNLWAYSRSLAYALSCLDQDILVPLRLRDTMSEALHELDDLIRPLRRGHFAHATMCTALHLLRVLLDLRASPGDHPVRRAVACQCPGFTVASLLASYAPRSAASRRRSRSCLCASSIA